MFEFISDLLFDVLIHIVKFSIDLLWYGILLLWLKSTVKFIIALFLDGVSSVSLLHGIEFIIDLLIGYYYINIYIFMQFIINLLIGVLLHHEYTYFY